MTTEVFNNMNVSVYTEDTVLIDNTIRFPIKDLNKATKVLLDAAADIYDIDFEEAFKRGIVDAFEGRTANEIVAQCYETSVKDLINKVLWDYVNRNVGRNTFKETLEEYGNPKGPT